MCIRDRTRPSDVKEHRALHGLTRALINNMVTGVEKGYSKTLELVGVGYRAQLQGKKLVMNLGFSHPVEIEPIEGITFETPAATKVVVSGICLLYTSLWFIKISKSYND